MNQAELLDLAQETVNMVIEEMPSGLSPEEERLYLINAGRVMAKSCMVINEMVNSKPKAMLQ